MKNFAKLFVQLLQTGTTNEKIDILKDYLSKACDEDRLWTLYLFSGRKLKKQFNKTQLTEWAIQLSGIPRWLFEESYSFIGDLAETISLILTSTENQNSGNNLSYWIGYIQNLNDLTEEEKKNNVISAWKTLDRNETLIFNKLITGAFKAELSQSDLVHSIAEHTEIEKYSIARKLTDSWHPHTISFEELFGKDVKDISRPYPFALARPIEFKPEELGDPSGWHAEWKRDGIRAQLIKRNGELFIWSRRDELLTDKFPEFTGSIHYLPDGIALDGEIFCHFDGKPLPFQVLQVRIRRKNLTARIITEAPVKFMAYDLIEYDSNDIREHSLVERRSKLEKIFANIVPGSPFELPPPVKFKDWKGLSAARQRSRENLGESLLLRRKNSHYPVGGVCGDWWKWKADPYTFNGVLIYAQRAAANTSDLYSEFTFAVWHNDKLVTAAKANSGLTLSEINEIDDFIKQNTLERFGPVRTVKPALVFEIAFDQIAGSKRHKSGFALRFPRISRWRKEMKIDGADTIENLRKLIR